MKLILSLIILIPFQFYFDVYKHYTISLAEIVAVALILWSIIRYKKIKEMLKTDLLGRAIIFFIAIMFFVSIFAINPLIAFIHAIKWATFAMLYFPVMIFVDSKEKLNKVILSISIPAVFLIFIGFWQYLFSPEEMLKIISDNKIMLARIFEPSSLYQKLAVKDFNWYLPGESMRVFGSFLNINNFSQYIGLILPLMFGLFLTTKRIILKYFIAIISVALILMNVLTFSRGGMLGIAWAAIVALVILGKKIKKKHLGMCLILLMIFGFSVVALKPVRMRLNNRLKNIRETLHYRSYLWQGGLDIISRNPMTGIGPGNYALGVDVRKYMGPSHSNFLQIGAELGLVGLTCFLYVVILGFKISRKLCICDNDYFLYYGLSFLMIWVWFILQSILSSYIFGDKYGMMFWLVVGLNSALLRIKENIEHDKVNS